MFGCYGQRFCYHLVDVRPIYDEPAESALSLDIAQFLPLVPAMKPIDGDRAALFSRVLERIIDLSGDDDPAYSFFRVTRPVSDAQRKLMMDQAATFATLHLSQEQVRAIVRTVVERRHYMLDPIRDFPWLRAGYEEGIEKGIEKRNGDRDGQEPAELSCGSQYPRRWPTARAHHFLPGRVAAQCLDRPRCHGQDRR